MSILLLNCCSHLFLVISLSKHFYGRIEQIHIHTIQTHKCMLPIIAFLSRFPVHARLSISIMFFHSHSVYSAIMCVRKNERASARERESAIWREKRINKRRNTYCQCSSHCWSPRLPRSVCTTSVTERKTDRLNPGVPFFLKHKSRIKALHFTGHQPSRNKHAFSPLEGTNFHRLHGYTHNKHKLNTN